MTDGFPSTDHTWSALSSSACEQPWVPREEAAQEKMFADEVQHYFCSNYKGFNAPDDEPWTDSGDDGSLRENLHVHPFEENLNPAFVSTNQIAPFRSESALDQSDRSIFVLKLRFSSNEQARL